jgi:hypothetical protein
MMMIYKRLVTNAPEFVNSSLGYALAILLASQSLWFDFHFQERPHGFVEFAMTVGVIYTMIARSEPVCFGVRDFGYVAWDRTGYALFLVFNSADLETFCRWSEEYVMTVQ